MPVPPVFAYNFGFTLQTLRRDLLFLVIISEGCVLTLMAFLFPALIGAISVRRKEFPCVVDLVSERVLYPYPFPIHEYVYAVGFFKITRQCSFAAFLAFLAYWCSVEID